MPFTDTASWRLKNCVPVNGTNGVDAYASSSTSLLNETLMRSPQQAPMSAQIRPMQHFNVILGCSPTEIDLPPLQSALPTVNIGLLCLKTRKPEPWPSETSGMMISKSSYLVCSRVLSSLKSSGATQLIIDLVSPTATITLAEILIVHFNSSRITSVVLFVLLMSVLPLISNLIPSFWPVN
jgi:hypothetical protein